MYTKKQHNTSSRILQLTAPIILVSIALIFLFSMIVNTYAEASTTLAASYGWRQTYTNSSGSIYSLAPFNGQLYAGVSNYSDGATIWRSTNGINWAVTSSPGFSTTYTNTNPIAFDFIEYKDQLYASTGNWFNDGIGGQIWRTTNSSDWTPIEENGFGDADNAAISTLATFSDTLYAATGGNVNGLQIWRSDTGNKGDWTRVITNGNGDANNLWVTGFHVFQGQLFAAIEASETSSAKIWRTPNGTDWIQTSTDGFGDSDNYQTGGMAEFNGYLYVGTRNNTTGGQMWRSNDGTTWSQVISNGFENSDNYKIESIKVYKNELFAFTANTTTGIEVWRSSDGTNWDKDASNGFGNTKNIGPLWNNSTVIFNDSVLIGIDNEDGGQIWQRVNQVFLPIIIK